MPRNMTDMETMELYKKMPISGYKDASYYHAELCSNCGRNEYEDMLRNIAVHRKKIMSYERHCPSCHCPFERQRFSPPGRSRTSENIETMQNRYGQISIEPINSAIKKSQSSPLSQKVCWHDCRTKSQRCPKRLLQSRRQRRREQERASRSEQEKCLFGALRMKTDMVNSEFTNEDIEAYSKYIQPVPIKRSLKKHKRCGKSDGLPDEQEYSDVDSEVSVPRTAKYIQCPRQPRSHTSNLESRRHCIGGDGEYITGTKNESDIDRQQNEHECQEIRKLALESEDLKKLKRHETPMIDENERSDRRRKFDVGKEIKAKKSELFAHSTTENPSALAKGLIDKPTKEFALNGSARLVNLDLHTTKTRILESIDHMLGTMEDANNDTPEQEQIEQKNEGVTHELQRNDWQLLFNALTIHRDSTDFSKRTVRLECLNHIQQELDRLYALESALDNCPSKQQILSCYGVPHNEEHQALEPKIANS